MKRADVNELATIRQALGRQGGRIRLIAAGDPSRARRQYFELAARLMDQAYQAILDGTRIDDKEPEA